MAISGSLRRLLHIRTLEEEQRRIALESALSDLHRLENALRVARASERGGRQRVALSSRSGDTTDRIAGIVECETARRSARFIEARIPQAMLRANAARDEYLAKRVERRQVETVIQETQNAQDAEAARRNQQIVDEWFSARRHARSATRQTDKKREMENRKETVAVPEEELRSNL
jgi:flagellar biosynthesis chaperone FliJ